ncbi:MAG: hypothetical protein M1M20_gp115 [Dompiswa phage TSP7_1]|uniref:Uncharacterized protein n=1 Tax=Dompiswa phage TSP7_1 TaxID=2793345 RepID=A0A7T3N5W6_9CAUD|nr:MAG: hypothetical protein M1M20_gp115 [Dompiswa phage TSP7_1]QPX72104.1 MAG: hypothetical protein [Dompiswa phage TSP7_1]
MSGTIAALQDEYYAAAWLTSTIFQSFLFSFCLLYIKKRATIFLPRQPGRTSKKGRYHDKYYITPYALIGLARRHGAPGSERNGLKGRNSSQPVRL